MAEKPSTTARVAVIGTERLAFDELPNGGLGVRHKDATPGTYLLYVGAPERAPLAAALQPASRTEWDLKCDSCGVRIVVQAKSRAAPLVLCQDPCDRIMKVTAVKPATSSDPNGGG